MFQLFRNISKQNWNKIWKKWKYQTPFLVFRNTETMDYIGKKLKRTETGRKLTKSKCFSCFETFRNKIETRSGKSENTRPHFWCFETLKQWIIQRKKLKRTETGRKLTKSKHFSCFETFRNKIETRSGKNWNGLKQFRNKIKKKLKRTETGRKLTKSKRFSCFETKSKCFSCFETKLKQDLEKVKIPGPISGVSKHWNNALYREKIETDWNRKKIDWVQMFQLFWNVSKQNWNKLWKSENTRPHFWCFETLKQWII